MKETSNRKLLKPIRPNYGVALEYKTKLVSILDEMHHSSYYWVMASYKKAPPLIAMDGIQILSDASPFANIKKKFDELKDKFVEKVKDKASDIANMFVSKSIRSTNYAFEQALRDVDMPVKLRWNSKIREAFRVSLDENVSLIKSIPDQYFYKLKILITEAYTNGWSQEELSEKIHELYPVTKKRALFIARDQSRKLNSVITRIQQEEVGITEAIWFHSDIVKKPRPDHVAANGKVYKVSSGCEISGKHIYPGQLINCRCYCRSILPFGNK
jgi:SPP1 gp7 family putative phage head morphogenesis protein